MTHTVAIVGTGPAALMCASRLSLHKNISISLFEQNSAAAVKLLIAGKTGLNVTNTLSLKQPLQTLQGSQKHLQSALKYFDSKSWQEFLLSLGFHTFCGSGGRVLLKEKTTDLVRVWIKSLKQSGCKFFFKSQFKDFYLKDNRVFLKFENTPPSSFDAVVFALGGASYTRFPCEWLGVFARKGIKVTDFSAANVGFCVNWSKGFLKEAEGKPLKNIIFKNINGKQTGELVITNYGLEGAPIYKLGAVGLAHIDLKPDLSKSVLLEKLRHNPKKLSPLRLALKKINFSDAAKALLFHETDAETKNDLKKLVACIKDFPVELVASRPLSEAISCAGGVKLGGLTEGYMLKDAPGIFLAGEMLDWSAPTGGFLIQTCVSQGAKVAHELVKRFQETNTKSA